MNALSLCSRPRRPAASGCFESLLNAWLRGIAQDGSCPALHKWWPLSSCLLGIFQQWFNLDTKTDPRMPAGDLQSLVTKFEQAYADSVNDIYQPKVCLSVIGSSFEVQQGSRSTFGIFVGEDVKTQAGPDLKALIASHKQQAAYIDALHEELRRLNTPSYRPLAASMAQPIGPASPGSFAVPRSAPGYGGFNAPGPIPSSMAPH
ncbi:unnamed protein product [Symbiodinium pilosum]|uniref:Uncharacterized protein n=1 Tax=Symbiodinium pilosum TaxID=2952 RepID=A0A812YLC7_SYMPI|nr:unnamed protein product [Symbiodinium pilosum]